MDWTTEFRFPAGAEIISLRHRFQTRSVAQPAYIQCVPGLFGALRRVKLKKKSYRAFRPESSFFSEQYRCGDDVLKNNFLCSHFLLYFLCRFFSSPSSPSSSLPLLFLSYFSFIPSFLLIFLLLLSFSSSIISFFSFVSVRLLSLFSPSFILISFYLLLLLLLAFPL